MDTQPTTSFWQKNRLIIKAVFIGFLTLALLIPTFFIMFLIQDRETRRDEVVKEVSNKWAGAQTITGPFLAVPYYFEVKDAANQSVLQKRNVYLLPDELIIDGKILPQIKHRSIFQVPVYNSSLKIKGTFLPLKADKLPVNIQMLRFEEAVMCMGIT
ncbi:MAG: inner membrane CreD family protein, partial [Ferruginibacter sp.]|nr:inner membrane CreD family protein [Ferruginibacter sp.]